MMTNKIRKRFSEASSQLYLWAEEGNLEKTKEWLEKGGNPNHVIGYSSVLYTVVLHDDLDIAELLLKHGANPNFLNHDRKQTVLMAVKSPKMLKLLARFGANPKYTDGCKNTAWLFFVLCGQVELVKAWMELGWPTDCKEKRLINRLLAMSNFDMVSLITGFQFENEDPFMKLVEFETLYSKAVV
jgi:ankyrin repeat protein